MGNTVPTESSPSVLSDCRKSDLEKVAAQPGLAALAGTGVSEGDCGLCQWGEELQTSSSHETQQAQLRDALSATELKFAMLSDDLRDGKELLLALTSHLRSFYAHVRDFQPIAQAMCGVCSGFQALHRLLQRQETPQQSGLSQSAGTSPSLEVALVLKTASSLLASPSAESQGILPCLHTYISSLSIGQLAHLRTDSAPLKSALISRLSVENRLIPQCLLGLLLATSDFQGLLTFAAWAKSVDFETSDWPELDRLRKFADNPSSVPLRLTDLSDTALIPEVVAVTGVLFYGKVYTEVSFGVAKGALGVFEGEAGANAPIVKLIAGGKVKCRNGVKADSNLAFADGDKVGILVDFENRLLRFYKNGTRMDLKDIPYSYPTAQLYVILYAGGKIAVDPEAKVPADAAGAWITNTPVGEALEKQSVFPTILSSLLKLSQKDSQLVTAANTSLGLTVDTSAPATTALASLTQGLLEDSDQLASLLPIVDVNLQARAKAGIPFADSESLARLVTEVSSRDSAVGRAAGDVVVHNFSYFYSTPSQQFSALLQAVDSPQTTLNQRVVKQFSDVVAMVRLLEGGEKDQWRTLQTALVQKRELGELSWTYQKALFYKFHCAADDPFLSALVTDYAKTTLIRLQATIESKELPTADLALTESLCVLLSVSKGDLRQIAEITGLLLEILQTCKDYRVPSPDVTIATTKTVKEVAATAANSEAEISFEPPAGVTRATVSLSTEDLTAISVLHGGDTKTGSQKYDFSQPKAITVKVTAKDVEVAGFSVAFETTTAEVGKVRARVSQFTVLVSAVALHFAERLIRGQVLTGGSEVKGDLALALDSQLVQSGIKEDAWKLLDFKVAIPIELRQLFGLLIEPFEPAEMPSFQRSVSMMTPAQYHREQNSEECDLLSGYLRQAEAASKGTYTYDNSIFLENLIEGKGNAAALWTRVRKATGLDRKPASAVGGAEGDRTERTVLALLLKALRVVKDVEQLPPDSDSVPELLRLLWKEAFSIRIYMAQKQQTEDLTQLRTNIQQLCVLLLHTDIPAFLSGISSLGAGVRSGASEPMGVRALKKLGSHGEVSAQDKAYAESCKRAVSVVMDFLKAGVSVSDFAQAIETRRHLAIARTLGYSLLSLLFTDFGQHATVSVLVRTLKDSVHCVAGLSGIDPTLRRCLRKQFFTFWELNLRQVSSRLQQKRLNSSDCSRVIASLQALVFPIAQYDYPTLAEFSMRSLFSDLLRVAQGQIAVYAGKAVVKSLCVTGFGLENESIVPTFGGEQTIVAVKVGEKVPGWVVVESQSTAISYLPGDSEKLLVSFTPDHCEFAPRSMLVSYDSDSEAQTHLQTVAWHVFKHFVYSTAVEKLPVALDSLLVSSITEQVKKIEDLDITLITDLSIVPSGRDWTKPGDAPANTVLTLETDSRTACKEVSILARQYLLWEESGLALTSADIQTIDRDCDLLKLKLWLDAQGKCDLKTRLDNLKSDPKTSPAVLDFLQNAKLASDTEGAKSNSKACVSLLWLLQLSPSWGTQRFLGVNEVKEKLMSLVFSQNSFLSTIAFRVLRSSFLSSKAAIEFSAPSSQVAAITEGQKLTDLTSVLLELAAVTQLSHISWRKSRCGVSSEMIKALGNEAISFLLSSLENEDIQKMIIARAEDAVKSLEEALKSEESVSWKLLRGVYFQLVGFVTVLQGQTSNLVSLLKTVSNENLMGVVTAIDGEKVTVLVTETGKFEQATTSDFLGKLASDSALLTVKDKKSLLSVLLRLMQTLDLLPQKPISNAGEVLQHYQVRQLLTVKSLHLMQELSLFPSLLDDFSSELFPVVFSKLATLDELIPESLTKSDSSAYLAFADEADISEETQSSADLNNLFKLSKDFTAGVKIQSQASSPQHYFNNFGQQTLAVSQPTELIASFPTCVLHSAAAGCREVTVLVAVGSDKEEGLKGEMGFKAAGITVRLTLSEGKVTCVASSDAAAGKTLFESMDNRKIFRFRLIISQTGLVEVSSLDYVSSANLSIPLPGIYHLLSSPFSLFSETEPFPSLRGLSIFEGAITADFRFYKEFGSLSDNKVRPTDPRQVLLSIGHRPQAAHLLSLTGFQCDSPSEAIIGLAAGRKGELLPTLDIDESIIEEIGLYESLAEVPITHTIAKYWKDGVVAGDCSLIDNMRIVAYKKVKMGEATSAVTSFYVKQDKETAPGMITVGNLWKSGDVNTCLYVIRKTLPGNIHVKLHDFIFIESVPDESVFIPPGCQLAKYLTGKEKPGVACPVFNVFPTADRLMLLTGKSADEILGFPAKHLNFIKEIEPDKEKTQEKTQETSESSKSFSEKKLEKYLFDRYSESRICGDILLSLSKVSPWLFASYLGTEEHCLQLFSAFRNRTKQLQSLIHEISAQETVFLQSFLLRHSLWQLLHILLKPAPIAEQLPIFVESAHPYDNNMNVDEVYVIPGALKLIVEFTPQTKTENGCDVLTFYRGPNHTEQICQISGEFSNFKTIEVPGDRLHLHFRSDGSVVYWGYAFTITPISGIAESTPVLPRCHQLLNPEFGLWLLEESEITTTTSSGIVRVLLSLLHSPSSRFSAERLVQLIARCVRVMTDQKETEVVLGLLLKEAKGMWQYAQRAEASTMSKLMQAVLSLLPVSVLDSWLPSLSSLQFSLSSLSLRGATSDAFVLSHLLHSKAITVNATEESAHPYPAITRRTTMKFPGIRRFRVETDNESAFDAGHDILVGASFSPADQTVPTTLMLCPSAIRFSRVSLHSSYQLSQNDQVVTGSQNTWSTVVLDKEVGALSFEITFLIGNCTENFGIGVCLHKLMYDTNTCGYEGNNFCSDVHCYKGNGCINGVDSDHRINTRNRVSICMDHRRNVTFKLNGNNVGTSFVSTARKMRIYLTSHGTINATIESYKDNSTAKEYARNRTYYVSGEQLAIAYPVNKAFGQTYEWSEDSSSDRSFAKMGPEDHDWKVFKTSSPVPPGLSCFQVRFQSIGSHEVLIGLIAAGEPLDQPITDTNCFSLSSSTGGYLNSQHQAASGFQDKDLVAVMLDTFTSTITFLVAGIEVLRMQINPRTVKKQLFFAVALSAPGQGALIDRTPLNESLLFIENSGIATCWGVKMTVSPVLTDAKGLGVVAAMTQESLDLWEKERILHTRFSRSADAQLVSLLDKQGLKLSKSPIDFSPSETDLSPDSLLMYTELEKFTPEELLKRIEIIKLFNINYDEGGQFINGEMPSNPEDCTEMQSQLLACKNLLFYEKKFQKLKSILDSTASGSTPTISINRMRANFLRKKGQRDLTNKVSVFAQVMKALSTRPAKDLWVSDRVFRVELTGEGATDAGGPYNEIIATMGEELMSDFLPLFIPSPNNVMNMGLNRDAYIVNPDATSQMHMEMYRFVGVLFGIAIRTQNNMAVTLPPLFWKRIGMENVDVVDLKGIDENGFKALELLRDPKSQNVSDDDFAQLLTDFTFTTKNSAGREVSLTPTGKSDPVTLPRVLEYASLIEQSRLSENLEAYKQIREGLGSIVPLSALLVMAASQTETLVCGAPEIDVERLKGNTGYEGYSKEDPVIVMFWEVLAEMTAEQRSSFIRFVWGRARLPASGSFRQFKITRYDTENPDQYLPLSHTCFFTIDLPKYSTKEILRNKLLYSITHCLSIDNDHDGGNLDLEE